MSDFFLPYRSDQQSQANHSDRNSVNEGFGVSFGKQNIDHQSFGVIGGSYIQNQDFSVQGDLYRSSLGIDDSSAQIQIYQEQEQNNQKSVFFRGSGDFEMQFEEIGLDKLSLNQLQKSQDGSIQQKILDQNTMQNTQGFEMKIESSDIINNKFKPEVKQLINQNVIEENKNLFNVNQAKSIYTSKINQLVEQAQNKIETVQTKQSPRLSKSQQKLQKKSPAAIHRDNYDISSNELNGGSSEASLDPLQKKLAKNRESARNSRARKKIYFELLETKVQELQDEVERLKEVIKNQTIINETCGKSQEKFQQFLDSQQHLFDKLETCILKQRDNTEIGMILDALRYRTNSQSQERNDAARNYFDSMVEVCLPIQTKYLIYALEKNKDFFANQPDDYTEWMKDSFYKTEIKPEQIIRVKKMKSKLQSVRNNISDSIEKIKVQLKTIQSEAYKVDQMWEQLKECLTPIQLGTCVLSMKQNAYRYELQTSSIFLQLKNSQMSDEDDPQQMQEEAIKWNNRKQIKTSI